MAAAAVMSSEFKPSGIVPDEKVVREKIQENVKNWLEKLNIKIQNYLTQCYKITLKKIEYIDDKEEEKKKSLMHLCSEIQKKNGLLTTEIKDNKSSKLVAERLWPKVNESRERIEKLDTTYPKMLDAFETVNFKLLYELLTPKEIEWLTKENQIILKMLDSIHKYDPFPAAKKSTKPNEEGEKKSPTCSSKEQVAKDTFSSQEQIAKDTCSTHSLEEKVAQDPKQSKETEKNVKSNPIPKSKNNSKSASTPIPNPNPTPDQNTTSKKKEAMSDLLGLLKKDPENRTLSDEDLFAQAENMDKRLFEISRTEYNKPPMYEEDKTVEAPMAQMSLKKAKMLEAEKIRNEELVKLKREAFIKKIKEIATLHDQDEQQPKDSKDSKEKTPEVIQKPKFVPKTFNYDFMVIIKVIHHYKRAVRCTDGELAWPYLSSIYHYVENMIRKDPTTTLFIEALAPWCSKHYSSILRRNSEIFQTSRHPIIQLLGIDLLFDKEMNKPKELESLWILFIQCAKFALIYEIITSDFHVFTPTMETILEKMTTQKSSTTSKLMDGKEEILDALANNKDLRSKFSEYMSDTIDPVTGKKIKSQERLVIYMEKLMSVVSVDSPNPEDLQEKDIGSDDDVKEYYPTCQTRIQQWMIQTSSQTALVKAKSTHSSGSDDAFALGPLGSGGALGSWGTDLMTKPKKKKTKKKK